MKTPIMKKKFCIQTMLGSSLPPIAFRVTHVLFMLTYLCLFAYSGVQHILCCVFVLFVFVLWNQCCLFLWVVLFLFAPSVFSNVYFRVMCQQVHPYQQNGQPSPISFKPFNTQKDHDKWCWKPSF